MESTQAAAISYRGDLIENTHVAHIAVVDAQGKLLYRLGDPFRVTLARSAAKPAQALSVVETGALEQFGFDEADLALMCASHSSEDRHIERAKAMLAKAHAKESDLRCGGHAPISDAVYDAWVKSNFTPTGICSNCSGKHAGMLAGAQALGAALADYHLPSHPMQLRVKRTVAEECGLPDADVMWAIDGCNLPTPAFPLDRLARVYARLANAADKLALSADVISVRTRALARIYHAMTRHPELVAGEGRYCTLLMQAFDGSVVGKLGADASYGVGIRASAQTARHGAEGAIGISIKVESGNVAVLYMLVSELLERLDIGAPSQRAALAAFHRPAMSNTKGIEIGHMTFPFTLQKV